MHLPEHRLEWHGLLFVSFDFFSAWNLKTNNDENILENFHPKMYLLHMLYWISETVCSLTTKRRKFQHSGIVPLSTVKQIIKRQSQLFWMKHTQRPSTMGFWWSDGNINYFIIKDYESTSVFVAFWFGFCCLRLPHFFRLCKYDERKEKKNIFSEKS